MFLCLANSCLSTTIHAPPQLDSPVPHTRPARFQLSQSPVSHTHKSQWSKRKRSTRSNPSSPSARRQPHPEQQATSSPKLHPHQTPSSSPNSSTPPTSRDYESRPTTPPTSHCWRFSPGEHGKTTRVCLHPPQHSPTAPRTNPLPQRGPTSQSSPKSSTRSS